MSTAGHDWTIDVSDAGTDVKGEILDRLVAMDDDGDGLDVHPMTENLEALAAYIADAHAVFGEFSQDELNDALEHAADAYIGEDLEDWCFDLIEETEQDGSLARRYAGAIASQMAHDMQCAGEVSEHEGVWFRTY